MKAKSVSPKLVFAIVSIIAPCAWAQDGLVGAVPNANFVAPFGPAIAVADFDNDREEDGAVLIDFDHPGGFRLEFHISSNLSSQIVINAPDDARSISARDIDQDQDIDIVVEHSITKKLLHLLLNDGKGVFTEVCLADRPFLSAPTGQGLARPPYRTFQPPRFLATSLPDAGAGLSPRLVSAYRPSSGELQQPALASSPSFRPVARYSPRGPPQSHPL